MIKRSFQRTAFIIFTLSLLLVSSMMNIVQANAASYEKSVTQTLQLDAGMQYELTIRTKKACSVTATVGLVEESSSVDVLLMYDTDYKILSPYSANQKESLSIALEKGNNIIYITNNGTSNISLNINVECKSSLIKYITSEIKSDEI